MIIHLLVGSLLLGAWAQESGTVTGTVYDAQTGQVVRGATVEVVGTDQKVQTDLDGRYTLKLAVGTHQLRAFKEGYFDQPIENVVVAAKQVVYLDPVLVLKSALSTEVVVEAQTPGSATARSVLVERKSLDAIADLVSAEELGRNPDSTVAGALERVTGISVMDDKYIFVRGLGERYSSTQLNGSTLPSTEPERKDVPFDLLQANLINKITTLKTYTPDQPGDYSGGIVKMETLEFPAETMLKYSIGASLNTNVSLQEYLSYPGTHLDWLGFGHGHRRLPVAIPDQNVTPRNVLTGQGFTPEELQHFGRQFRNTWEARSDHALPNFSQGLTGGGTFGRLGAVGAATWSRGFSRVTGQDNSYVLTTANRLLLHNNLINDRNSESVKAGFIGNLAYKLNDNHKLQLKNFYTRDSDDQVRVLRGVSGNTGTDDRTTRLRYVEESIYTGQVTGEHYLQPLGNSVLEWKMAYSRAARREPDLRENIYSSEVGKNEFLWSSSGQSGYRQFSDQFDDIYEPGLDWTFFYVKGGVAASFKTGGLYYHRERDYDTRRFIFKPTQVRNLDFRLPAEQLFAPTSIGPGRFELREITRSSDAYDASHRIWAGYGMADVSLGSRWRLLGGVRFERSNQHLSSFNPTAPGLNPLVTNPINKNLLSAAGVVYSPRSTMNFRGGYSRTLNRPELRELAPFQFTDITGKNIVIGNPGLCQATIDNYDARWEWFYGGSDLVAVSYFHKRFRDPIERVQFYAADPLITWVNSERARSQGLEIEARQGLGILTSKLDNWSIHGNYSRILSRVELGEIQGNVSTSKERALQGQASFMFNAVLEFVQPAWSTHFRILYNAVGPRITLTGAFQAPDVTERTTHFVDLSFAQRISGWQRAQLRFTVKNLLNRAMATHQGGLLYNRDYLGRTFGLSLSYDIY